MGHAADVSISACASTGAGGCQFLGRMVISRQGVARMGKVLLLPGKVTRQQSPRDVRRCGVGFAPAVANIRRSAWPA
jgi:hypothetical protein